MIMLSPFEDVVSIFQSKFFSTEKIKSIHLNVSSVTGQWNEKHNKCLVLVENKSSHALFLFSSKKLLPENISDLRIDAIIPIDKEFSCYSNADFEDSTHLIFVINYKKIKLEYRIKVGPESAVFATEVIKSHENSLYSDLDYSWLLKYTGSEEIFVMDGGEGALSEVGGCTYFPDKIDQGNMHQRDSLLKYQLKQKEYEYIQKQKFTIFVGTWNVNGQLPSEKLGPWLSCDEDPPDLYAIGFQEIDLSKEAFLFNDTPREEDWIKMVSEGVHPKAKYRTVIVNRLVGILLIVMINIKHYQYIKEVAIDSVGTGLLGKMGNKGGVAVRMQLHNTYLCFVNCHLAAHVDEYERRNQDYREINSRVNFRKLPQSIHNHSQIYWLGDLNYRITALTTSQVKTLLQNRELTTLLKADQLNQQKDLGRVLHDYKEADISFAPTYKYDLHTDIFDTSEKARPPAWTDRILWKGDAIYLLRYRSHMVMKMSDHKPVSALFSSEIDVVDQTKYRKVHEELLKKLDKIENEFLPQVTVDQTEVKFDLIKFREPQVKEIIIANTGQLPVEFEFIKKLDEEKFCKDWLRVEPYSGTINPGDKCDVRFEVNLDSNLTEIYDILVLHLKGGKDMFITVSGPCQRSSFIAPMTALCRTSTPIMQLSNEQWAKAVRLEGDIRYSVPREIWLLIDYLYRNGLKTKDLFESTALQDEVLNIRDWLDYGSMEPLTGPVYVVAECLLLFLTYTSEPVIPNNLHEICIAAANNYHSCRQIVQTMLSDVHRNVFLYICLFLQEVVKHSTENGYDAKTLSLLFGDILLRNPDKNLKHTSRGRANFVYNFLVNDLSTVIIR